MYTPERLVSDELNVSAELPPDKIILANTAFDRDQKSKSYKSGVSRYSLTFVRKLAYTSVQSAMDTYIGIFLTLNRAILLGRQFLLVDACPLQADIV